MIFLPSVEVRFVFRRVNFLLRKSGGLQNISLRLYEEEGFIYLLQMNKERKLVVACPALNPPITL